MLKSLESKLPVCVKLIWQPAEEGGAGAEKLVAAGVLDGRIGPKVEAIFGLHGWPGLKVGLVSTKPGALLAYLFRLDGSQTMACVLCIGILSMITKLFLVGTMLSAVRASMGSADADATEQGQSIQVDH